MEIIRTNNPSYKKAITALYIEAFSSGQSEQFIDLEELSDYIDSVLKNGYALISTENESITGVGLICPLAMDNYLPKTISDHFQPSQCLYIAEMMVTASFRGKGIGQRLMEVFDQTADKTNFSDAFIRVWIDNIPAVNLYKKMGFDVVANIEHAKIKADGSGTFVMKKIYLHKKLN
jgi:GNAT superfamily N-acetyltransferase